MSRTLTAALIAELAKQHVRVAFFGEIVFASGTVRAHTGLGTITWNGQQWSGLGNLIEINAIEESLGVVTGMSITLSGIPSDHIDKALDEVRIGNTAKLWFAALDEGGQPIADPLPAFSGFTDRVEIEEGPETSNAKLHLENEIIRRRVPPRALLTNEEQQRMYPGDGFLKHVADAAEGDIPWGVPGSGTLGGDSGGGFSGSPIGSGGGGGGSPNLP